MYQISKLFHFLILTNFLFTYKFHTSATPPEKKNNALDAIQKYFKCVTCFLIESQYL